MKIGVALLVVFFFRVAYAGGQIELGLAECADRLGFDASQPQDSDLSEANDAIPVLTDFINVATNSHSADVFSSLREDLWMGVDAGFHFYRSSSILDLSAKIESDPGITLVHAEKTNEWEAYVIHTPAFKEVRYYIARFTYEGEGYLFFWGVPMKQPGPRKVIQRITQPYVNRLIHSLREKTSLRYPRTERNGYLLFGEIQMEQPLPLPLPLPRKKVKQTPLSPFTHLIKSLKTKEGLRDRRKSNIDSIQ